MLFRACQHSYSEIHSAMQSPLVVAADKYGSFYIAPENGTLDPSSINARGGLTINAATKDYNPEVIKV